MKKLIAVVIFLSGLSSLKAQQDMLVSHYMFNHLLLNPAYAGTKDYMMASLLYRKQWAGWDGAPESEVASIHGPVGLTNFGWGALITHDKIGVTDKTDAYVNAAYHIPVLGKYKLSVGLRGGGSFYNYKNSDLLYWDENDPAFAGDEVTDFQPNVGWGLFFYSEKLYAGISVPTVISYEPDDNLSIDQSDSAENVPNQVRHYYTTAGYAFEISSDLVLKPSILLKHTPNAPVEFDFNVNALLRNLIWVGVGYRTGDSFVGMLEVQLSRQLRLGYSYDFTTTDVSDYSNGSHEISLGFDFGYDIKKVRTPRYF
jgi:type IX secretion system PorP/SprF family membrane protein